MTTVKTSSSDNDVQSLENLCQEAIDQFIEDHRQDRMAENPFVKVVLEKVGNSSDRNEAEEDEFERAKRFIAELEKRRREGRTFRILEKVTPFLASFVALIRVCEGSLQAAPFGVGIAFTGLRLILDLATRSHEVMGAVVDAIGEISIYLNNYKMVLEGQSEPSIISESIRRSYRRILEFWCHSAQILSKSKTSFAFSSLVRDLKRDVQEFKEGISLDACQVDQSLNALNVVAETRKSICDWIAGTREAALQRPKKALDDYLQCRTEGTCEWIFETAEFKEWRSAKGNAVLWYNADPGTGKSVLTSAVIDHLMAQPDLKVLYFFYSFVDSYRREIYSGVRSLAFQLLARLHPLPFRLKAEYAKAVDDNIYYLGNDDSKSLKIVLQILLDCYAEVYIALDGLDECSDEKTHVSRDLEELLTLDTTSSVKWLITSRDVSEIRYPMSCLNAFEIRQRSEAISRDIQTYRDAMGMGPTQDYEWFDSTEQSFLYTRLLCENLASKGYGSKKGNWEELQKFPVGLEGTYLSALRRISKLGHRKKKLARQVFQVLTLAKRLLTVPELLDYLDLHVDITQEPPTKGPSQHLQAVKEVCSPLLTIEGDTPFETVRLCHKTVKDFFLDAKNRNNAAHELKGFFVDDKASAELGSHFLEYLSHERYQRIPGMDELREESWFEERPFLRYAATYWHDYLWHAEPTPEVIKEVEAFLQSPAFLTCIYVQSRTAPYLFAMNRRARRPSGHLPKLRRTSETSAQFALRLPLWMQERGKTGASLNRSLCEFLQDWGELIVKHPDRICDATPLTLFQPGCYLKTPGKNSNVRFIHISQLLGMDSGVRVVGSRFPSLKKKKRGGKLQLDLLLEKGEGSDHHAEVLNVLLSSKEMKILGGSSLQRPPGIKSWCITTLVDDTAGHESANMWQVDPHDLSVYRSQFSKHMVDPESRIELNLGGQAERTWSLIQVNAATQPVEGTSTPTSRLFHMRCDESPCKPSQSRWNTHKGRSTNLLFSQTSIMESNASSSEESSADSSTDSFYDSDPDTHEEQEDSSKGHRECLIIATDFGKPTWLPITTSRFRWSRLIGARHPTLDVVAVSHRHGQIDIICEGDHSSKEIQVSENIPKAKCLALSRELQFSACGGYIHLLSITFHDAYIHTECVVSISTYVFDRQSLSLHSRTVGPSVCLNYCFSGKIEELPQLYVVTEWTAEHIIVALPPLTHNPKIIKVSLAVPASQDDPLSQSSAVITTLDVPIYFPKSCVSRNPQIRYWDGTLRQEPSILYLIMDAPNANDPSSPTRPSCGPGQVLSFEGGPALSGTKAKIISPPVVMRWKIQSNMSHNRSDNEEPRQEDSKEGHSWRDWDQKVDRFSGDVVPIRSGLNWARKGFLICD